jgi:hypothetical protein
MQLRRSLARSTESNDQTGFGARQHPRKLDGEASWTLHLKQLRGRTEAALSVNITSGARDQRSRYRGMEVPRGTIFACSPMSGRELTREMLAAA